MKVFISYSVGDTETVRNLASKIEGLAQVFYWEKSQEPGSQVWPKIFKWIDEADIVLVVISDQTIRRAFAVGQEVGHARKANKRIIPMVAKGVANTELGFLSGITYIPFDGAQPHEALAILMREIAMHQIKQADGEQKVLVLAGLALLFLLASD